MASERPRVLVFLGHYLPGYKCGGPLRSICNLVEQLSGELQFRIVTSDRDLLDPEPYAGVRVDQWSAVGKAEVFYGSAKTRTLAGFRRLIQETRHDLLYLNSFFNPRFTLLPLLARALSAPPRRPVVIAPRGEFSPGALGIKRWKKAPYLLLAKILPIYRDIVWQGTTEYETADIAKTLGATARRIAIAPNLPGLPETKQGVESRKRRTLDEPLRVCFVSRILPTKNLKFALEVVREVKTPLSFDIYGPAEDPVYWSKCQALIAGIKPPATVRYMGGLAHDRVRGVLSDYDLFFLPTLGENFGHVILEAMQAGTPVLLADTTPWRNLERAGLGWDLPLSDRGAFVAAIEQASKIPPAEYDQWRERVLAFALHQATEDHGINANRRLFLDAVRAGNSRPVA